MSVAEDVKICVERLHKIAVENGLYISTSVSDSPFVHLSVGKYGLEYPLIQRHLDRYEDLDYEALFEEVRCSKATS